MRSMLRPLTETSKERFKAAVTSLCMPLSQITGIQTSMQVQNCNSNGIVVVVVVGGGVGSSGGGVSLQLIHTHLTHKVGRFYSWRYL